MVLPDLEHRPGCDLLACATNDRTVARMIGSPDNEPS